jgi:hypothetical protein
MRLSYGALRRRRTNALYPDHRTSPWLNEAASRDRSNRLLGAPSLADMLKGVTLLPHTEFRILIP